MTLINDRLDDVKTSLLVAIKKELTDTYPKQFGDYKSSKGDIHTKVYWADTVRFQPRYPYCTLTPVGDKSEGFDEITYYKDVDGILKKRVITRSFISVAIDVYDMGNEQTCKTSLEADNFAHKVTRQLRKYFNGDDKLDWFSGNEYYERQIGITITDDISAILGWGDTDPQFRYTFTIQLGWDEYNDSNAELANGAIIGIEDESSNISDTLIIKKDTKEKI